MLLTRVMLVILRVIRGVSMPIVVLTVLLAPLEELKELQHRIFYVCMRDVSVFDLSRCVRLNRIP